MGPWLINAGDSAKTKLGRFWAAMLATAPGPRGPGGPLVVLLASVAGPAAGLGVWAVGLAAAAGTLCPVAVAELGWPVVVAAAGVAANLQFLLLAWLLLPALVLPRLVVWLPWLLHWLQR